MGQDWEFVPPRSTDEFQADAKSRQFVRRRAMRVVRERQRAQQVQSVPLQQIQKAGPQGMQRRGVVLQIDEEESSSSSASPVSPEELASTSQNPAQQIVDLSRNKRKNSRRLPLPSPVSSLEADASGALSISSAFASRHLTVGHINPLKTYSQLGNPTRERLFDHFIRVIAPQVYPLGRNSDRSPIVAEAIHRALTQPLFLDFALFHALVHLDLIQGKPLSSTTYYQKGQVMRQINHLMNTPGQETSNTAIMAVGLMAGIGNVTGDFTEDAPHMKALKRMVDLRGGLDNLDPDGTLKTHLSTIDLFHATLTMSKPHLDWIPPGSSSNWLSAGTIVFDPMKFEQEMQLLFKDMSDLSSTFDYLSCKFEVTLPELTEFYKRRSMLEQRLLCFPVVSNPQPNDEMIAHIFNACRVTALLCSNNLFRGFYPTLSVLRLFTTKLREDIILIESSKRQELAVSLRELLLWIYFVAGMTTSENTRYVENIVTLMDSLGLASWDDLERCLSRYLFPEKMRDQQCLLFWQKVQLRRSFLTP